MNGRTLDGKYRLIRCVGAGGMGAVHVAERVDSGGMVAIKLLSSRDHASNPAIVERFYREVQAAGRIDSPHITRVLDAGTDPESGVPYMAMELLRGQDLHRFTQRVGPLDPELVLRISAQVCRGLVKAHEANVVHLDIKPANLFLTRMDDGTVTVKVLDFGIAKLTHVGGVPEGEGEEDMNLTRTSMLLGSPLFMSPEQTGGTKYIDHRSDLWSLGTVMFRMLAGRTPYEHIRAMGELIYAICSAPPPSVQNLAPWVPPELAGVIERVLRLDPNERCQSAAELYAAIQAVLGSDETITEDMLVGLRAERRAQVAPRRDGRAPMAIPENLPSGRSSAEPYGNSPGSTTTGSGEPASSASVPGPGWVSGPGLPQLSGISPATSTSVDRDEVSTTGGQGPVSSRRDSNALTRPIGPVSWRSSGPVSVRSSGSVSWRSSGPASVRSSGPVSWRSNGPVSAPLSRPVSVRSSEPVSVRSSGPASFPTGSDPLHQQAFPGSRSTVATARGTADSASLLEISSIPAFRPSRFPMFVAGGVVGVLVAVALVQLNAGDPADQIDPTTAAVTSPPPSVETPPTPSQATAKGPAAEALPAASGSGTPAGTPLRDDRKSGGPPAADHGPASDTPGPTPQRGGSPARSPTPHAPTGHAPAPLDPNGFGDRK